MTPNETARGPAGPSASHAGDHHQHLSDYLRVIYRRRWTAATAFLVVFALGAIDSLRTASVYEAKTQILIENDKPKAASLSQVFDQSENWYNDEFYQTQYRILQSRSLARKTMDALNLWEHPQFGGPAGPPQPDQPSFSIRGALGWARSAVAGLVKRPEPRSEEPADRSVTADQSQKIDAFLGRLTVTPVKNSRLVDLRFQSADPTFAASTVNALATQYIQQNLEFRFSASKEASTWLGEQLAEQRKKVAESEAALQRYKETHDAVAVEDRQNIVVQKLADLNAVVTRAKTERIEKEALYNQIKTLQEQGDSLDSFSSIQGNEFFQKLRGELADLQRQQGQLAERYGERHPEMVKIRAAVQAAELKLKLEAVKVVESVRNDFLTAQARERSLVEALNAQKGEALSLNRKGIEYSVLERDAVSNRQVYESLLQRAKETGISGELKSSNIHVVDAAEVPRSPILPNTRRDITAAAFAGCLAALGLVFFFEYLDNRIKSPQEVKAHLGLPVLGMVPVVRSKDLNGGSPLLGHTVPPAFSEAMRSIRTNVLFSSAEDGGKALVITSTGPNEGKTVVGSNLALALAQAGQRVLLVDADMRRPRVHEVLGQALEPGLSNVMVGTSNPSQAIRQVSGLWVMAAGHLPPNPAELLGSPRFQHLLKGLKQQFDWVIIDSPPVMAVTDASILAHIANGVVFVIGADMTNRKNAAAALEQLDAAQAKFVGAVLNRVDFERNAYYYSQYYRREYAEYYARSSQA